jgi:hypothetical protein
LKLKQLETSGESDLLKAKLARTQPGPSKPTLRLAEPQVAVEPRSPVREQPQSAPAPIPARRLRQSAEGRIVWWRGYMSSEFQALMHGADDAGQGLVMRSPSFRWRKSTPPPRELATAAAAYLALVDQLRAAGWVVAEDGEEWYASSFYSRTKGDG